MKSTLFRVFALAVFTLMLVSGCKSTYDSKRISASNVKREGTIVWVRPKANKALRSLRRRMEVTYEQAKVNDVGLLEVRVGCRNKSGSDLVVYLKTAFYEEPFAAPGSQTAAPVYESTWQRINLIRGATDHYKAVCPRKSARFYQVTISEDLQ